MLRHLNLFAGIGGASLAAEMVWDDVKHIFCEIDPFCQTILKKHWPNAYIHGDIKTLKGDAFGPIDIITGGFPCQPFSAAGKRRGTEDDRHLWPEMLRVIREASPTWIIGENVSGLLTWNGGMVLDEVFSDLEDSNYEVGAFVIPAASIGAPHRRERVWIIAHTNGGANRGDSGEYESQSQSQSQRLSEWDKLWEPSKPDSIRYAHDSDFGELRTRKRPDRETDSLQEIYRTAVRRRRTRGADSHVADSDATDGVGRGSTGIPDAERVEAHQQEGQGSRSEPTRRNQDSWREEWPSAVARLCAMDDGLPGGLVRPKGWRNAALKAAGNAWVPQVAAEIMRGIKTVDNLGTTA